MSLLRYGYPDWLLLKKGDVWTNEQIGCFHQFGRSAREPLLISSYGSGSRPLLKTDGAGGICSVGGAGRGVDFVALVGIEFYAYTRDPSSRDFNASGVRREQSGGRFLNPNRWLLIEDCKFSFYTDNLVFELGPVQYVALRRNVIVDSYSTSSHSQGLLANNIISLLIEENVFDHNGWNESVPYASPTIFNHNLYLQGAAADPKSVSGPGHPKGQHYSQCFQPWSTA